MNSVGDADDDPAALRAMVEQWRTQSSMLSDMVRELQESEKAAWRAANEAREQAVREARATLLQAACPGCNASDLAATLRAELATERQANTRMQQLLRAQEEKISLLEQMLRSTRDVPHDGASSGVVAAQSWLPRWLGTSANGSSSGGAGGGSGSVSGGDGGGDGGGTTSSGGSSSHESGGATEEAAWSRWLTLPRPLAAATPIKAQAWHSQTATPSVTAARAAPPAAASSAAAGGLVTNVSAAVKATPARAAAAAPPLSPAAGEDSAAEWTGAHAAARRLQLELRTEPRKRASAAGGGGAGGAAHVECFLESFLHTVERGGAIGGSVMGAVMGGGGSATGGAAQSTGAHHGAQSTAVDEADATNALTPDRGSSAHAADADADAADAVANADVAAGSPCVDLDVPASVDFVNLVKLETAAAPGAVADLAGRRGLCLQPCVVVALGATHDDRVPGVGYRPSPPVTTRVRHAGSPGSTHRSGGSSASRADQSSACSTVTLSSAPSTDRSAG